MIHRTIHSRRLLCAATLLALLLGLAAASPTARAEETYVIGPSDILEIIVWKEDSLSRTDFLVRPDGRLSMPLIDDVQAAGLTPMQLKAEITRAYAAFLDAPRVYILVRDPRSKQFSVLGNVQRSGSYPLLNPTSVLQGLAQAQGFTEWAHKDEIMVFRGHGVRTQRLPFMYSEVLSGKALHQNVLLEPGDVIVVP